MRKRKIFKAFLFAGCITALTAFCANTVACKEKEVDNRPTIEGVSFAGEEVKVGPQFLEGALTDLMVNENVKLDEYIDYVKDGSYTITLTDENGNVTDFTKKTYWKPDKVGTYVLTYTVTSGESVGTASLTLTVRNPELTCEFNILNQPYNYGEELNFNEYFGSMNIYKSLPGCKTIMDSVEVDGEIEDLTDRTSYVFESRSDHTFKFHVEAPDGQTCEGREVISIKYVDEQYLQELTDMGISMSGELYVEDGSFTMVDGRYANGNNVILQRSNGPHISPYIAYNGEYGIGSYVKLDFTGKNMPIFSFFRDEYSSSMFDGSKGIVFTGGLKNNSGAPSHPTITKGGYMYGPNMLHKPDEAFNSTYRDSAYVANAVSLGNDEAHPISLQGLQDGTRYRIMIGFSNIEATTATHLFTKEPGVQSVKLTLSCALLDLDNMQLVTKFTVSTYALQALGFEDVIPTDVENNEYFKGNIVLYGNYGARTVFDKIYPIITDTTRTFDEIFADELDYSEFKPGAKTSELGTSCEIRVSDYVETSIDGYIFYYVGEDGVRHDVKEETFVITKPGSYTFYYIDGENLCASMAFNLIHVSAQAQEWIASDNIKLNGIESIDENKSVVLKSGTLLYGGTYTGPNPGNVVDQAYLAFDGNYSYNDFIAFDFTGKNMPEVAFFAQNYNNSMYYQDGGKQGMVFVSGITNNDGTTDKNILKDPNNPDSPGGDCVNVHSPFMIDNANENWFVQGGHTPSALARANLVDGTHYRVILGVTYEPVYNADGSIDRTVPTIKWYLYNLDTNEVVESRKMATWNFFTGSNPKVNNLRPDDLFGSIVLYGKFGTTLSIDKLYGVFEDTTIENVANALNKGEAFDVTFVGLNGEVLKTLTDVPAGEKVSYGDGMPTPPRAEDSAFTYAYAWDKPLTRVSQDTVYTLTIAAKPKSNVKTYNSYVNGASIKLNSSWIGNGANYTKGQQNGGGVDQSYFAIDGNYGVNTFVAFDFTGKNMPEIAFFAKNYNNSMYAEGTSKQGIVVVTGITTWDGKDIASVNQDKQNGTYINYGYPYMIQDAANGGFCEGAFADSALGRANLVDGKHYRIIMGFTGSENKITLHWYLYDLDENVVVEQSSMTTWGFFNGNNANVGNMTIEDLVGSIVLYGKFGVETHIDRFCGVYEDSSIDAIVTELGLN